jgi:NAD(P)-dependent dehydrogenase (short-subunit alcohol dehydrogenase family)
MEIAFMGLKHAAAVMRELGNGGSIILASSIAGLRGTPGYVLEATSKSALNGLAQTAAGELGKYGIRVNTIHPSGLGSVMAKSIESPQELEEMRSAIPLGRFAQVDDVASVVAFLASEDSKFMTGGDLKVDGGIVSCEQSFTPAITPASTPAITPSF